MASIFLSYAREDRRYAETLARTLESAGHRVWWDRHIDSGQEFAAQIETELDKSDVILVAWSAASSKSRWVRDEATIGGDSGRLIPVTIDGSLPPMGFRQFHTMDLRGWKGSKRDKRTAELLHSIGRRIKRSDAAQDNDPVQMVEAPLRKAAAKGFWTGLAALVLVTAAAIALISYRLKSSATLAGPAIALVPFTTASNDPELRELGAAARDSLAHTFSQSGLPLQLANSISRESLSGTDFVISGDLSRRGNKVIAAVRLDESAHSITVFSHAFEATGDDVQNLPERIGAQMAGDLTWAAPLEILHHAHTLDASLIAGLLGEYDFTSGFDLPAYQASRRIAAKAPDVGIAQITFAFNTAFVLGQLPRDERPQAVSEARDAAQRAMNIEPKFGDTYAVGCLLRSEVLMAQCERQLRAGRRLDPDAPFLNSFLAQLLRGVGRVQEAAELASLSYAHDPYVPTKIGWMLLATDYQGESDAARDTYRQAVRWWPEFANLFLEDRMRGLIERGDFDAAERLDKEVGRDGLPRSYRDSGVAAIDWKSRSTVRSFCSQTTVLLVQARCMLALSRLGDLDGAYAIADKLYPQRLGSTAADSERIWLDDPSGFGWPEFITSPAAAQLRRDHRYLALARRTGLLAYWRSIGPPDFCRTKPEPICADLLKGG